MPELPEVETVVRTLRPHILGHVLVFARLVRSQSVSAGSLPLESVLGYRVSSVERRGKLVLLQLSVGDGRDIVLTVHLRMTGSLIAHQILYSSPVELLKWIGSYTCVILGFAQGEGTSCDTCVCFNDIRRFGKIFITELAALSTWPFWSSLGPEPLEIEEEAFAALFQGRRAVKNLLMDQKMLAGIGNIYADESLYAAGVHPLSEVRNIPKMVRRRLLYKLQQVLRSSISACGSSIRNYCDADGNVGAFQNNFAVYGRAGSPCQSCGRKLEKIRVGGRATVFCPNCQTRY